MSLATFEGSEEVGRPTREGAMYIALVRHTYCWYPATHATVSAGPPP